MKKFLALAVAVSALAVAAPASAQAWQSINQRQANLDQRIDMGVRNGSLTRNEAVQLREEFRDLGRLEMRYRATYGLSESEQRDLDRRFDALSARIRFERNDGQDQGDWNGRDRDRDDWNGRDRNGQWMPINQRQRQLDARIDAGVRDRSLSRAEASSLRAEFSRIVAVERRYRRGGLSNGERRDLDRRFDRLGAMIQAERNDRNNRFG